MKNPETQADFVLVDPPANPSPASEALKLLTLDTPSPAFKAPVK